jgi:hypothetical protein
MLLLHPEYKPAHPAATTQPQKPTPDLPNRSFTAQPQAPAFVLAGASGWAVNGHSRNVTKVTERSPKNENAGSGGFAHFRDIMAQVGLTSDLTRCFKGGPIFLT